MNATPAIAPAGKIPWHIWTVAILSLLWNGSGAITILMAQAGTLTTMSAEEAAYYAAQATWFVLITDVALFTPLAAAVALMLRSKAAVWLFGVSLGCILVTNVYGLVDGSSRALANGAAMVVTCIIVVLAILQFVYAHAMQRRGILR